jgi:hypothetical protein
VLLRTIFLLAFLAVLGETIAYGAMALAQAQLRQRALDATKLAFANGVRSVQEALANGTAPLPAATCAYANAGGCAITVTTSFATAPPSPAASSCPGTPCAIVLQRNTAVSEGRAAFTITATASSASGGTLATRSSLIAFRTFAAAPYAALVGSADGSFNALANGGPGDDAGNAATLIDVELDASTGGSSVAGNVWQSAIEAPAQAAPAWDR